MKDRIAFYLLTSLALSGVFILTAGPVGSVRASTDHIQSLRFDDETGRNIEIGMYGSILSLYGVRPIREGYAFAYQDPQSSGKDKVVYYADKQLSFGLKPVSLTSNVPAGSVALGQKVTITAVVATDDGLFQSTHVFRWTAGNDDVEVTRIVKKMASDAVGVRWFNVILTLNAKDFSKDENIMSVLPESCPPPPPPQEKVSPQDRGHTTGRPPSHPPTGRPPRPQPQPRCPEKMMSLKVLRPVAWAVDKSSHSANSLLRELSHDHFPLPKQAGKYDVVLGLSGDSPMSNGQSLILNYVYRMEPKEKK
jgi:hypothetical protein